MITVAQIVRWALYHPIVGAEARGDLDGIAKIARDREERRALQGEPTGTRLLGSRTTCT
jgi:hypothetical protein